MSSIEAGGIVTIGAALFATSFGGFISLYSLISNKEQKISEFRQIWIDTLRESVSNYISHLSFLSNLHRTHSKLPREDSRRLFWDTELIKEIRELSTKKNAMYNDIIFRINPSEKDPQKKEINSSFLNALDKSQRNYDAKNYEQIQESIDEIRTAFKPLLKFEWERVKKGEPSYKNIKALALSSLLISIAMLFAFTAIVMNKTPSALFQLP